MRHGVCDRHPAADQAGVLIRLLQGVTCELEQLQQQAPTKLTRPGHAQQAAEQAVGLGLGLAISLCDALALMRESSVEGLWRLCWSCSTDDCG